MAVTSEGAPLVLTVHLCKERRDINVTVYPGPGADAAAADYVNRRSSYVACSVNDEDGWEIGIDAVLWPLLADAVYPICEHGMSAQSCYGPGHFPSAEWERSHYGEW
jgi:hypothetical protein